MGRPREHNEATRAALLEAAERLVAANGVRGLSVRGLADEVGTTTRAIYSLFGSRDNLVAELGAKAFTLLGDAVAALPTTDDPAADLVEAGVNGFRRLFVAHPNLFQLGIQRTGTTPGQVLVIRAAGARAWTVLQDRVHRLGARGGLGTWNAHEAATAFHALCEGLAALEIRGLLPPDTAEQLWRDALTALVEGFRCGRDAASRSRSASRQHLHASGTGC